MCGSSLQVSKLALDGVAKQIKEGTGNQNLTEIGLAKFELHGKDGIMLCDALTQNFLIDLDLSRNFLLVEGVEQLIKGVKDNTTLRRLNIFGNYGGDRAIAELFRTADKHPRLCALDVGLNEAGHQTVQAIVDIITRKDHAAAKKKMEELEEKKRLHDERKGRRKSMVGTEAQIEAQKKKEAKAKEAKIKALESKHASGPKTKHKLREVHLAYNMIGSQIRLLLASLLEDDIMQRLDISYNCTGDSIVSIACLMLKTNKRLEYLNASGNHISGHWVPDFVTAVKRNDHLKYIFLGATSEKSQKEWAAVTRNLPRLKKLMAAQSSRHRRKSVAYTLGGIDSGFTKKKKRRGIQVDSGGCSLL